MESLPVVRAVAGAIGEFLHGFGPYRQVELDDPIDLSRGQREPLQVLGYQHPQVGRLLQLVHVQLCKPGGASRGKYDVGG